jgi:hypothetical protein
VSITNGSGRALVVELVGSSPEIRMLVPRTKVHLRPGENVLSIPVSLGTSSSGRIRFSVEAGGYRFASATTTVAASYQDRIVLLAAAVLILAGLLLFIRRRVAGGTKGPAGSTADDGPEA